MVIPSARTVSKTVASCRLYLYEVSTAADAAIRSAKIVDFII